MNTVLISIVSMVGLGIFFGILIAVADKKLAVQEDPAIAAIEALLPGVNCGACGKLNCHNFAVLLVQGNVEPGACLAGGEEFRNKVSALLGIQSGPVVKKGALVHCAASTEHKKRAADYDGVATCRGAQLIAGGGMECRFGCLAYGDCVRACPFQALSIANGRVVVDYQRCTACGKCVQACPRGIIDIAETAHENFSYIACRSRDKGARVMKVCKAGCIACGICQKISSGVYTVSDNLAAVDYARLPSLGNAAEVIAKCPTKVIKTIT